MATKKTNGHDPATGEMVALLREIRDEIHGLRDEAQKTNERLDTTNAEVHEMRGDLRVWKDGVAASLIEIHREIARTNAQLTVLNHDITDIGEEIRGGPTGTLKARVERLERIVLEPTGT